jgi:hypothetical protein
LLQQKEEDEVAEAIVAVTNQKEEALAGQQTLLSLCKKMQNDKEASHTQSNKWAEGMAGLSTILSCCNEMGDTLSAEDKTMFSQLLNIKGRLAAFTKVVDEPDHDMEKDEAGAKSFRTDEDSDEAAAQAKRQKTIDEGTQPPQQNEPGSGSTAGVASGASNRSQPGPFGIV